MFLQSIRRNAFRSLVPKVEAVVCASQRASASSLEGMKGKGVSRCSSVERESDIVNLNNFCLFVTRQCRL